MNTEFQELIDSLARTPIVLRAAIEGRPESWLDRKHAEDVVSPREAVAHLVLCEHWESFPFRIKWVLSTPGLPDVEEMSGEQLLERYSIPELLDLFVTYRAECIQELLEMHLSEENLLITREDEDGSIQSVSDVLHTWVAHDFYHLGQIFKSYSAPYQEKIGMYQDYLNLPHFN
jgi:hypothetical protein